MKANELRIGNLVFIDNERYFPKLKNTPLNVLGIDFNRDCDNKNTHSIHLEHINQKQNTYYESYSQFIKYIKSVPLTEEWLIKAGGNEDHERYFIGLFCIHYDWDENGNKWFYYCPDTLPNIKINTVHQLQNLYFALTGKELAIKL